MAYRLPRTGLLLTLYNRHIGPPYSVMYGVTANTHTVTDGHVHVSDAPGAGIAWSEDAVEKYSVAI